MNVSIDGVDPIDAIFFVKNIDEQIAMHILLDVET
jgi:hypothetical protein